MAESFSKKQNRIKKDKRKQDKMQKKEDRKFNNNKGKDVNSMMVYLDKEGNITDVPPELQNITVRI